MFRFLLIAMWFTITAAFMVSTAPHSMLANSITMVDTEATRDSAPGVADGIVTGWQPAALSKVTSTLNLVSAKGFTGFDAFTMAGSSGKVESFEGPGTPNVAWCSGLTMSGGSISRSSVTAFCGPLTDVPHLICACGVSDGGVDLYIDFRPRADGAYDPACATLADYPDPETREAFAEGGNRKDFAAAFFTDEIAAAHAELLALGTPAAALSKDETATISAGPLLVDVRLPLDQAQEAADACSAAVDRWLTWMSTAEEMKRGLSAGMRQTATYTRDTKVRANHFGFLLKKYIALFGEEDGKNLASADAGPLDEAYVGGGS